MWEDFEEKAFLEGYSYPVGLDEAGRGALAGPVVAAACFIPSGMKIKGVNDSKKMSAEEREEVYERIISSPGVFFAVAAISAVKIDQSNILAASLQAMMDALDVCPISADFLLIDGNQKLRRLSETSHKWCDLPYETVVSGDSRVQVIAAASILAKVHRDRLMNELHKLYPQYAFDEHKGYATKRHQEALRIHGPSKEHRLSYKPIQRLSNPFEQLTLF